MSRRWSAARTAERVSRLPWIPGAALSRSIRRTVRRSEEHTSELQSQFHLVCRLLLEKKKRLRRTGLLRIGHVAELAASALVASFVPDSPPLPPRLRCRAVDPLRPLPSPARLLHVLSL